MDLIYYFRSINKRTHLKLVGAQFAVNQQQIVATEALGVSYFAHPAQGSHRMKGGFSVGKNSGQIILDGMVEQVSLLISFYYSQCFRRRLRTDKLRMYLHER
jgi:hypothetical protein